MNYSKQREEILQVLRNSYNHPTAEEIYFEVKKINSTSSRGTVYRNLGLLVENEIIIKIPIKNGPDRYDYMKTEHNHVICDLCEKVFDFEYQFDFEKMNLEIKNQTGVTISKNCVIIHGICEQCKNSSQQK
ncbi:Peroxide operon regulator [compost metagenome]